MTSGDDFISELISIGLKRDIAHALFVADQVLEIDTRIWIGESKSAYDAIKSMIEHEIRDTQSKLGDL